MNNKIPEKYINPDGRILREYAEDVFEELEYILSPYCSRIEVAGSIRRKKSTVHDIEMVIIPKMKTVEVSLFDSAEVQAIDDFILNNKDFEKRLSKIGIHSYGEKNKLLIYKGMPLDIFTASPDNFLMVKFIRTGGANNNKEIATRAIKKGFCLKQYECGFLNMQTTSFYKMHSEEEIYAFLGMPYIEPEKRT